MKCKDSLRFGFSPFIRSLEMQVPTLYTYMMSLYMCMRVCVCVCIRSIKLFIKLTLARSSIIFSYPCSYPCSLRNTNNTLIIIDSQYNFSATSFYVNSRKYSVSFFFFFLRFINILLCSFVYNVYAYCLCNTFKTKVISMKLLLSFSFFFLLFLSLFLEFRHPLSKNKSDRSRNEYRSCLFVWKFYWNCF